MTFRRIEFRIRMHLSCNMRKKVEISSVCEAFVLKMTIGRQKLSLRMHLSGDMRKKVKFRHCVMHMSLQ